MRLIQAGQITDGTGHIYTWQLATHIAAYWSNRLHCMNIDIYVLVIVIHATVGMIGEAPVEPEHGCPVGVSSSLYYISLSLGFGNIAQHCQGKISQSGLVF